MTFYSQNCEDVLLARCFENIDYGFYVDVGAEDPDSGSVTRFFYERGWRGLNVEPVPAFHERLRQRRPRDLNVAVAASDEDGRELLLNVVPETGLSSLEPSRTVQIDAQMPGARQTMMVRTARLDTLLDWARLPRIDFLKIDVEGHEQIVLDGLDLERYRPKVIVVETTEPLIYSGGWVPIDQRPKLAAGSVSIRERIEAMGYQHVLFDGLNSWWIAKEASMLEAAFRTPPNVFDTISPMQEQAMEASYQRRLEEELGVQQHLRGQLQKLWAARRGEQQALQVQRQAFQQLVRLQEGTAQELDNLRQSTSWKLTKPYRRIADYARKTWNQTIN